MKKIIVLVISCMFIGLAIPFDPNGIPNIGPLGAMLIYYNYKDNEESFEVSYEYKKSLKTFYYEDITLYADCIRYINSEKKKIKDEKRMMIVFERPISNLTGEIIIKSSNSKGKMIERYYKGTVDNEKRIIYDSFFDFSGIKEKSKVRMEFLLDGEKKISIKINGEILKDLISISESFPENANNQSK